jgi:hypothetical protein
MISQNRKSIAVGHFDLIERAGYRTCDQETNDLNQAIFILGQEMTAMVWRDVTYIHNAKYAQSTNKW